MSVRNNGTNIFITALFILISAFMSKYSMLIFMISFFLVCALNSYSVCNYGADKTVYINVSAVIFYVVASFFNKTLIITDIAQLCVILLPGIITGACFKKKLAFKDTMIAVLGFYFLVLLGVLCVCKYKFNMDITGQLRDVTTRNFTDQLSVIRSLYPDFSSYITSMEYQIFNTLYVLLPGIIPFATGLVLVFAFLLQYALSKMACTRYLIHEASFQDGFDTFKLGLVTNIAFALFVVTILFEKSAMVVMICVNAALFILLLYFVSALSFIEYKFKARAFYPGKRLALTALILIVSLITSTIVPIVNFIYIFIFFGFLDSIFDFRKLNAKKVD